MAKVHPDCINASNPWHECVGYCYAKIAEAKDRAAAEKEEREEEITRKLKERTLHPDCVNASNTYHECSEYCFRKIAEAKEKNQREKLDVEEHIEEAPPQSHISTEKLERIREVVRENVSPMEAIVLKGVLETSRKTSGPPVEAGTSSSSSSSSRASPPLVTTEIPTPVVSVPAPVPPVAPSSPRPMVLSSSKLPVTSSLVAPTIPVSSSVAAPPGVVSSARLTAPLRLVALAAPASSAAALPGLTSQFLHEKVVENLLPVFMSKLELIRPPESTFMDYGPVGLDMMQAHATSALNKFLQNLPVPSFDLFVLQANMLTDMLHSSGLADYRNWLVYLRKTGTDLLYLDEAITVRSQTDVNTEVEALKSVESKLKAEKAELSTLEHTRTHQITIKLHKEKLLGELATQIEITKKTLEDLEKRHAKLVTELNFTKGQEQLVEETLVKQQGIVARFEAEAKQLKDISKLRESALKVLEQQRRRRMERLQERKNLLS